MGVDFKFTIDSEKFKGHEGPKINYSDLKISDDEFYFQNHSLLFEHDIKRQTVECFKVNNNKAFFKTEYCDFPFDIFAAAFYLLSRYEEYLPHEEDMYGRYAYENSLAYKEGFLNLPLVNIWITEFANSLKLKFTTFNFQLPTFNFQPTYDIDMAWSYKHKGFIRNIGGFFRNPSFERIKVLSGLVKDPFDCYNLLNHLHLQNNLKPVYFFLVAKKNGEFDKNILPHKNAMWQLAKKHADHYEIGIHPSWQSNAKTSILKKEIQWLEEMSEIKNITSSRQHYIKLSMPDTYQNLIEAGITDEYSMGYGSINGFRASVASSFYWYNLQKEEQTTLRIHPFCFMDANSFYEQKQNLNVTSDELQHYLSVCKQVNGTLITIWHNNFLGTSKDFAGWGELYDKFISQLRQ